MRPIICGAELVAAARRQGGTLDWEPANLAVKYLGLCDREVLISNDLTLTIQDIRPGWSKATETPATVRDVLDLARENCGELLAVARGKDAGQLRDDYRLLCAA